MSKSFVVAVRDSAMNAYGRPFFVPSIGVAERSFGDEVRRVAPDNQMNMHPTDFELYLLGSFDEDTGRFTNEEPRLLVRGKDAAQSKE